MQRLPDLTGLKNEVIIPEYSRNVYDHAIRMVGVKIIEVQEIRRTRGRVQRAHRDGVHPGRTRRRRPARDAGDFRSRATPNVPVIVDAAAEMLTIPNVHLQRGATAVAYSGGKCIRGPQAAGLLLGEKNLLQAAWANSAPHHAFGRSLKVGKEEIMGMLAGRRDVEEARPRGGMEAVAGMAGPDLDQRKASRWCHDHAWKRAGRAFE